MYTKKDSRKICRYLVLLGTPPMLLYATVWRLALTKEMLKGKQAFKASSPLCYFGNFSLIRCCNLLKNPRLSIRRKATN